MAKPFFDPVDEVNHSSQREQRVLEWWRARDIFKRSIAQREGAPDFVFFEGPPTANGLPGVHHVQSRTFKDLVCRLKTMEGYRVLRKAGWDTHGLPVEIEVEKQLGLRHKADIEAYGIGAFNDMCRSSVRTYEQQWRSLTERIGFWVDLDDPYFTFTTEYIESVWWILSRIFQKGLIYDGFRILPYCPRCGTPLSSHEVSLGYDTTEDPSIWVRFPVTDPGPAANRLPPLPDGVSRHLLVWTTTPWTLISNTFVVVHPDLEYVEIEVPVTRPAAHRRLDTPYGEGFASALYDAAPEPDGRERFILSSGCARALFGDPEQEGAWGEGVRETARLPGADLVGVGYGRPFDFISMDTTRTHRVVADTYVTDQEGTGIVHASPAYGEDDYNTGRREQMPVVTPVDDTGSFVEEVTPWSGIFVKQADPGIMHDLAARGLLWRAELCEHTYPFCWRCDSPLLYMARPSWYIRTTQIKDRLLAINRSINWIPSEIGTGRMGEWLENNQDWALSRDRFWGTPLPIWRCDHPECGHLECIGSVAELRDRVSQVVPDKVDLHRPHVDQYSWPCSACGGTMRRTPEVIDVWFDSGAMPYAQWHYPFENRELGEKQFPGDFISEGIDQTRGWFYSLLAIGALLFDQPAFKNCLVTELVLDKNGQKMSKSRGNAVDPWSLLDQWGADPLRWYLITNSPPWAPTRFDSEQVAEASRKFFGTLHNTHAFFALYANVDGFEPDGGKPLPHGQRPVLDRWIRSRLHGTARSVRRHLGRYEITRAARELQDFVIEDLSNWYVRRARRRFWKGEQGPDKESAYQTLHEVLVTTAGLLAPFIPFTAEELWRNLQARRPGAEESVHLSAYPAGECDLVDPDLDRGMAFVRESVRLGRAARNRSGLRVRQPLSRLYVAAPEPWQQEALVQLGDLIREEMNVKEIEAAPDADAFTGLAAAPQFKKLGPKFGKDINHAAEAIRVMSRESLGRLREGRSAEVVVDGRSYRIEPEDITLIYTELEGLAVEREGTVSVALDIRLTPALRQEGLAREFITRVQALRRQLEYAVTDRIRIGYRASDLLHEAVHEHQAHVMEETLAVDLQADLLDDADRQEEWEVDGESVTVTIKRNLDRRRRSVRKRK